MSLQSIAPAVFEVDRFEWSEPGRLEVQGRWSGLAARRFMRPTMEIGGRRLLASLEHKPWIPEEGVTWVAAFPWSGEPEVVDSAHLSVSPGIEVTLPAPYVKAGTTGPRFPHRAVAGEPIPELDDAEDLTPDQIAAKLQRDLERERGAGADMVAELTAHQRTARRERDDAIRERDAAMAERDTAVAERDMAQAERDVAVGERDRALAAREVAESDRDDAFRARDDVIGERDRTAADLAQALRDRERFEEERDTAIKERDGALRHSERSDRERDKAIRARHKALTERDGLLARRVSVPRSFEGPESPVEVWSARLVALGVLAVFIAVVVLLFNAA